ncbi:MAG: RNB domain-containing ribonuclease, partial [Bdellovibrionales bacterium]|nr:RNB domain-containing ribonuclease [Bdellovibrionales bacterium]
GNSPFDTLYNISTARELERFDQGGFRVTKVEIRFAANEKSELSLHEFYEQSPARNLVGEFMILANEYMARFAAEQNLPFIYRCQDPPDMPRPTIPDHLTGPALQYLQRAGLRPSSTQTNPGAHHMLGVPYYAQATSPIRRYLDLCNQRQIRNLLLHAEPLYSSEELNQLIEKVNLAQKRAGLVVRESHRQLILTYLWQQRKTIAELKGTVLRTDMKNPLLELDLIYMPYVARLKTPVAVGDERFFRIKRVDPILDDFVLEEIVE